MDSVGSDPRNLTNSADSYDAGPAWSPDGGAIVYSSISKKVDKAKAQIATVNLSNGQVTYLTNLGDMGSPAWIK